MSLCFWPGPAAHFQIKWEQGWVVSNANFCDFKHFFFKSSGREVRIMKNVVIQNDFWDNPFKTSKTLALVNLPMDIKYVVKNCQQEGKG